jgi:hypothetical protein
MTDIVERLRLCDEQMVALDHLNRPYGLAKSLEHEAADEIERLRAERDAAVSKLYNLEALRPHWAKGHSTDSVAAQVATSALSQVWTFLGVSDQTQCVQKLRAVLAERDRLREALQLIADASPNLVGSGPRATEYDKHRRIARVALKEAGHE